MSWLTGKVAMYVCGALLVIIAAMGVWITFQNARIALCTSSLKRAEVDIERLESEKVRFLALIAEQNAAVEKLKTVASEKAAAANEALAQARKDAGRLADSQKRIAALLGAPTPSGASCKEGVAAVRKELK